MRDGAAVRPLAGGGSVTWWVVALTVAAAMLRFYRIDAQSFWVDELWTIKAAAVGGTLTARSVLTNVQGPLHAVLVHLLSAAGTGEGLLRGLSAVFGVATVPMVYLLGREVVDRRAGLVAAGLATVSPFFIWYSQELRNYALLLFFATAATLAVWRIVTRRGGPWIAYGVATGLAILSNLSAVFLAAAHWVFALPRARDDRGFVVRWILTFVLVAVCLAPWIWGVTQWVRVDRVGERVTAPGESGEVTRLRGETTFTPMAIPYSIYAMVYGYSVGPSNAELHREGPARAFLKHRFVVGAALAALAAAGLSGLACFRHDRLRLWLLACTVLIPLAAVTLLALLNIKVFNARYVAVMAPLVLVLLGGGIARLPRAPAWIVGGLMFALCLVGVGNAYWNPEYWREDVRAAARYIEMAERPGDVILVPVVTDVFDHYYEGDAPSFLLYPGQCGSDSEVARRVEEGVAGHERVWLVEGRLWHADPDGRIVQYLERRHRRLKTEGFPGVTVRLYALGGDGEGDPDGPESEEELSSRAGTGR